jgi:molybdate transport system ATP-binding protein
MLAGLTLPDKGEIIVDGELWFSSKKGINRKVQERKIGFMFQDHLLFPNMTVKENLLYATNVPKLAEELLDITELGNLVDRYPCMLSGGQRQRVALARAIARGPELLLLDEPFSSLDPSMKKKLQDEIQKLNTLYPITTLMVSHDPGEISCHATRHIALANGRIIKDEKSHKAILNPIFSL